MTDETVLATPPAETPVADPTTKIEAPAETPVETTPEPEAPQPETTDEVAGETDEQPRKNVPGSQRLKRRLQLIESDHQAVLRENEELRRQVEQRQQPQNPNGRPGVDREPTEADFPNDYFAFERAKTAWEVRQSVRDEIYRSQQSSQQTRQAEARREQLIAYEENAQEVRERIPDFDKVVQTAASVNVKNEVIEELLASEKSALLQYHLAKNPDKVRELNAMTGRELAKEIGRLEARVHLPSGKKATEASAPPSQIRGGAAPPVDPVAGPDDMDAYAAWRNKQRKA